MCTPETAVAVAEPSKEDNMERDGGSTFQLFPELEKLFSIAAPTVLIQFSLFITFPMAASAVGRNVGTVELAAFSLGTLAGNLTCLSIMEGALTAADTLMPRAFGLRRYDEFARLAVRSAVVALTLLLPPVLPLCVWGKDVLMALGQDEEASGLAVDWIRVYFLGVPANLAFRILMRFLLSQQLPWYLVYASVIPALTLHPWLLGHFIPTHGLVGSAIAIVITQWVTTFVLVGMVWVRPPHKPETWPGFSWGFVKEALRLRPLLQLFNLSIGGIFTLIEWWFFEMMCFIAGTFGVIPLAIHTIAYNLVPLVFMLPLGILISLTVRIGHLIVEFPVHAKKLAAWCMGLTTLLGFVVSSGLFLRRKAIILLFTNDTEVVEGALEIWDRLCYYLFLLYIFAISQAIMRALGMQWKLAGLTFASLYLMTLPAVVYFAIIRDGELIALWSVLPICYTIMQAILMSGYVTLDWEEHAKGIRENILRQSVRLTDELKDDDACVDENTSLLA